MATFKANKEIVIVKQKSFTRNHMWNQFWNELKQQQNVDISLTSENKSILAHKSVLWLGSKYFEKIINSHSKEKQIVLIFHKVPFVNIIMALKFIYTGAVKMDKSRLESFLSFLKDLEISDYETELLKPEENKETKTPLKLEQSKPIPIVPQEPPTSTLPKTEEVKLTPLLRPIRKRHNNNIVSFQPPQKRLRFEEYHCAACDFICHSESEFDKHLVTGCSLVACRRNNLHPISSSSSSDSQDL